MLERPDLCPTLKPESPVLIADDQRLLRDGFRVILNTEPDLDVVGEAGDGLEAVQLARQLAPSVVLMDIRMPNMDGLAAARVILAETESRVLMLTTFDTDEYVYSALRAGASGFLLKDAPGDQLVAAVRSVAGGNALIDPSITRRLIQQFVRASRPRRDEPSQLVALTHANERSFAWSPAGCQTRRSPPNSLSKRARSRPTSLAFS